VKALTEPHKHYYVMYIYTSCEPCVTSFI